MKNKKNDLVHEFTHKIADDDYLTKLTLHTEYHHNGQGKPKCADDCFVNQELTISHESGGEVNISFYMNEFNSDVLRELANELDKNKAIANAKLLELQSKPEHKLKLSTKGK